MASILDVTDRKRAEDLTRQHPEKLARTARLVSMGEMASALAHELNQPLSAISSYATGWLNMSAAAAAARRSRRRSSARRAGPARRSDRAFDLNVVRRSQP